MAGSFFALFDDLSTVLDDVVTMTKLAAKKTSGVLGDDLALNAEQLRGMQAAREVPVVLAVAKGSFKNKLILVPLALAVSQFAPWAIGPMLVLGGLFLCYEGVEKLLQSWFTPKHEQESRDETLLAAVTNTEVDLVAFESAKIQDAVRTDFVLSAEIIVISLGTLGAHSVVSRLAVLCAVAVLMTVGVYGVVLGILKLDDMGLYLMGRRNGAAQIVGRALVHAAPWLMRILGVVGTAAVFLVGGGILVHGIAPLHHAVQGAVASLPYRAVFSALLESASGVFAGLLAVGSVALFSRVRAMLLK